MHILHSLARAETFRRAFLALPTENQEEEEEEEEEKEGRLNKLAIAISFFGCTRTPYQPGHQQSIQFQSTKDTQAGCYRYIDDLNLSRAAAAAAAAAASVVRPECYPLNLTSSLESRSQSVNLTGASQINC